MQAFSNGGYLVQDAAEIDSLPLPTKLLYLDFETSSGNPKLDSLNPWHNCYPIGFVYCVDDTAGSWFVPWQLAITKPEFMSDLFCRPSVWVNHHVKYDSHVLCNSLQVQLPESLRIVCTIVLARLLDSDRSYKGGYGLDVLCLHWLGRDMRRYYQALRPYTHNASGKRINQDYGVIPLDILAEYACEQVLANRELCNYCLSHLPDSVLCRA
jgi:hypothetical protein